MKIAALILWLITAGGGFDLLGTWLAAAASASSGTAARGSLRRSYSGTSRSPLPG